MNEILPAFCAGVVSTIVCNPLDVFRINYQLNNMLHVSASFMYRGIGYGLITIPSFWTIYFPTYNKTKEIFPKPIAAYLSCCTGSIFTAPFWYLRQKSHTNVYHSWKTPMRDYFIGLKPTLIGNLNFVIQIPVYEYLKTKIEYNTYNTFLITAISKTISTSVFYPFDTIRAKLRNGENLRGMTFTMYYRGISIYLARSIPYHASIFCTYEFIKNKM